MTQQASEIFKVRLICKNPKHALWICSWNKEKKANNVRNSESEKKTACSSKFFVLFILWMIKQKKKISSKLWNCLWNLCYLCMCEFFLVRLICLISFIFVVKLRKRNVKWLHIDNESFKIQWFDNSFGCPFAEMPNTCKEDNKRLSQLTQNAHSPLYMCVCKDENVCRWQFSVMKFSPFHVLFVPFVVSLICEFCACVFWYKCDTGFVCGLDAFCLCCWCTCFSQMFIIRQMQNLFFSQKMDSLLPLWLLFCCANHICISACTNV